MAERRPLVLVGGRQKELPAGDTLPGGGGMLYRKRRVFTSSGTFTLPATAHPQVDLLLVGGGCGVTGLSSVAGGNTTVSDSTGLLALAEGGQATRPGRGGGIGAARKPGASPAQGNPASAGLYGWGCGGATAEWASPGSGLPGGNAASGSGDGGGGNAAQNTVSAGGHGGGVVSLSVSVEPGDTCTHVIGAGGVGAVSSGGSGRVEYSYLDTVL